MLTVKYTQMCIIYTRDVQGFIWVMLRLEKSASNDPEITLTCSRLNLPIFIPPILRGGGGGRGERGGFSSISFHEELFSSCGPILRNVQQWPQNDLDIFEVKSARLPHMPLGPKFRLFHPTLSRFQGNWDFLIYHWIQYKLFILSSLSPNSKFQHSKLNILWRPP